MKSPKKITTKVNHWLDRAEREFERRSGWKSGQVKNTLNRFSKLTRIEKALFSGLLVTRAFRSSKRIAVTSREKYVSTAARTT